MLTLRQRLDELTTSDNKWNSWPDLMEVVSTRVMDLGNAVEAYEAGQLFGCYEHLRQVRPDQVPVLEYVPTGYANVRFRLDHDAGQEDTPSTRNVLAMYEYYGVGYRPTHLVVVEIGCKHDYDRTGSRMCYAVGRCRRCGHRFTRDSSD